VQFVQKKSKTARNFCAFLQSEKSFQKPLAKREKSAIIKASG
jgi:hypothetical protein